MKIMRKLKKKKLYTKKNCYYKRMCLTKSDLQKIAYY